MSQRCSRICWLRASKVTNEEVSAVARDLGVSTAEVLHMEQRLNAMDSPYDMSDLDEDESHVAPAQYIDQ